MAPEEIKTKKRKGATDASPKPKKLKKSDETAAANKKTAKALKSAVKPIDDVNIHAKISRKKAQDLYPIDDAEEKPKKSKKVKAVNEDELAEAKSDIKSKKSKKSKLEEEGVVATADDTAEVSKPKTGRSKKTKKEKTSMEDEPSQSANGKKAKNKTAAPPKSTDLEIDDEVSDEGDEDDQTAALLAGFESSEDEADPEADDGFSDKSIKPTISNDLRGELQKAEKQTNKPGVVYVGRIPRGFYEHQMKAYFTQFGQVMRLRLSRNKKTGHPKHYAFVEFASAEVADIVAKTMDKYLLFGHILQCRVIPAAQVHPDLFKGANKRFKAMPRSKIVASKLKHGAERAVWEKRVAKEGSRRTRKNKKLEEALGYTYDAPALKSVDVVPKSTLAVEAGNEPSKLLTDVSTEATESAANNQTEPVIQSTKTKKSKKAKKENGTGEVTAEAVDVVEPPKEKKAKKEKKSKVKVEQAVDGADAEDADEAPKEKKRKAKSADHPEGKGNKAKKAKATAA